jgi:hypothetical protein
MNLRTNSKKAQGEIFGLALVFVLLIFGVVIYGQIQASKPTFNEDSLTSAKYKILSENTISSLKKLSTPCSVQTGKNTLSDLMRYCMEFADNTQQDPELQCDTDNDEIIENVPICAYAFETMNKSIQSLLNKGTGIGEFPFSLHIFANGLEHEIWHERVITNINDTDNAVSSGLSLPLLVSSKKIDYISLNKSNSKYYLKNGYSRVNAGKDELTSGSKSLDFELNIYYR